MKVENYISNLLYEYDCVVVTNLGGFILKSINSEIDVETAIFKPPRKVVAFNSLLKNDDGILISCISKDRSISYKEAKEVVESFVADVLERVALHEVVALENVGALYADSENNLSFTPFSHVNYNTNSFSLGNFTLPVVNIPINIDNNGEKNTLSFKRFLKIGISAAAILIFGILCFTVADYGFQNIYYASFFPVNNQNTITEKDVKPADVVATEVLPEKVTEEVQETVADADNNEIVTEAGIVDVSEANQNTTAVKDEGSSSEVIEAVTESDVAVLDNVEESSVIETEKGVAVINNDFVVLDDGRLTPYIIVASYANYNDAKCYVEKLRSQGYNEASIIIGEGGRYRVSIASMETKEQALQKIEEIRQIITNSAWILYF